MVVFSAPSTTRPQLVSLLHFASRPLMISHVSPARRIPICSASSGKPDVPWVLMGRTVNVDPRSSDDDIPTAAAPASQEEELLKGFRALLPEIADSLITANRPVAVQLSQDSKGVAAKLVALTVLFPECNVLQMVDKRPSLLLDKEFEGIEGNLRALEEAMPGADVRRMVAAQPLFLSEDISVILGELRSLQPGKELREIVSLLAKDPKLSDLLVLRLDIRAQVRQGMPRARYP